jgi:hypothetical protein
MNMNIENKTRLNRFATKCISSCKKLVEQIKKAKEAIQAEYQGSVRAHEQLLHLALNEAEALAWETSYPHLVFPMLAREKAQAVVNWEAHQRSIRQTGSRLRIHA